MRDLIKMNFYRLSRSISAYIVIFLVILECVMVGVATYQDNSRLIRNADSSAGAAVSTDALETTATSTNGIKVEFEISESSTNGFKVENGRIPIYEFLNLILSNYLMLCFPLIGIALFITAQYKSGFIKNFAGNYPDRAKIIGADIIVSCAYSLILLAAAVGATFFVGLTLNRDITTLGQLSDNLDVILPKIIPYLGFSMLAVFICEAFRSATFAIIGGFALILFSQGIVWVIDYALHKIGVPKSFSMGDYFMVSMISKTDLSDDFLRTAIVGAVYFAVFAVAAILMFKKRDIA